MQLMSVEEEEEDAGSDNVKGNGCWKDQSVEH